MLHRILPNNVSQIIKTEHAHVGEINQGKVMLNWLLTIKVFVEETLVEARNK
jgi:hypothetical protein